MDKLHISISAAPIFSFNGWEITNSMVMALLVSVFLIFLALKSRRWLGQRRQPTWVKFWQTLIESFYDFVVSIAPQHARHFFPLVTTIFLFVLFGSWAGLLPGAETVGWKTNHGFAPLLRGATADINITLGLAIFAVAAVQFFGYKYKGLRYFKKFFDLSNPINFFVGFLELVAEFSRIMSFAFRLFGNIFAGEVLLAVIAFLLPLLASLPFVGLEIFVGFIQALVFATLTLVFINIAVSEHH